MPAFCQAVFRIASLSAHTHNILVEDDILVDHIVDQLPGLWVEHEHLPLCRTEMLGEYDKATGWWIVRRRG